MRLDPSKQVGRREETVAYGKRVVVHSLTRKRGFQGPGSDRAVPVSLSAIMLTGDDWSRRSIPSPPGRWALGRATLGACSGI